MAVVAEVISEGKVAVRGVASFSSLGLVEAGMTAWVFDVDIERYEKISRAEMSSIRRDEGWEREAANGNGG